MSRYIDKDKVLQYVKTYQAQLSLGMIGREVDSGDLIKAINILPTIDIVRCKDCKYYTPLDESRPFYCSIGIWKVNADDFCSFGERIEK